MCQEVTDCGVVRLVGLATERRCQAVCLFRRPRRGLAGQVPDFDRSGRGGHCEQPAVRADPAASGVSSEWYDHSPQTGGCFADIITIDYDGPTVVAPGGV